MSNRDQKAKRRGRRIVPIAVLAGAVGIGAGAIPACQDDASTSDMATDIGAPDDWRYPHDVSAHGFFDLANLDLALPDGGDRD